VKQIGFVTFLTTILMGFGSMLVGQEDVASLCTDEWKTETMTRAVDILSGWEESENLNQTIVQTAAILATVRTRCDGLTFTSEEYGQSAVTDIILFPDGVYKLVIEGNGSISVEVTELEGDCGDRFSFVPSDGGRVETVSAMEGCIALLEFSAGITDEVEWTVTYQPVILSDDLGE
jgi:hypothetical protein